MSNRTRALVIRPRKRPPPRSAFKKGGKNPRLDPNSGSGRKKGTPNRLTVSIKQMLENALNEVGGQRYFVQSAKRDRRSFLSLIGRLLPTKVTGGDGGAVQIEVMEKINANLSRLTDKEVALFTALLKKLEVTDEDEGQAP